MASVLTELNNRGVKDIFIACVDGLKGFPEAIESVFPQTVTQVCIVHQIRHSLTYISYKDRKAVAAFKPIYTAATEDEALFALEEFGEKWNEKYPVIAKSWTANFNPMFAFPKEIRKAIYTTNVFAELFFAKDHENESRLPDGRSGDEIDLAGIAKHREKVDNADTELESGDESVCDHI